MNQGSSPPPPPPPPPPTTSYHDSVHMGDVVSQKVMQQNIHHHSTQFQQVLQPCMGCGSRNYLKPIPCSNPYCSTICCNQCVKRSKIMKSPMCETHDKHDRIVNKILGSLMAMLAIGTLAILLAALLFT